MLMRLEAIWTSQSGVPVNSDSSQAFTRTKIWSRESLTDPKQSDYSTRNQEKPVPLQPVE
jgi:hypothetical protein